MRFFSNLKILAYFNQSNNSFISIFIKFKTNTGDISDNESI